MSKIAVIGAGAIGSTIAYQLAQMGYFKILLYDIEKGLAEGKALDIMHALTALGVGQYDTVVGSDDISLIRGADVVVCAAGFPRTQDLTRDDLFQKNERIIQMLSEKIKAYAPHSFIIIVTNPIDSMAWTFFNEGGWHKDKIVGIGSNLDEARFKYNLSILLGGIPTQSIQTKVIGPHNDQMMPLIQNTFIGGIPLKHFITSGMIEESQLAEIIYETRQAGINIVKLQGRSAYYAPAATVCKVVLSYVEDRKDIITLTSYHNEAVFIGQPCIIGCEGVEETIKVELDEFDEKLFQMSVEKLSEKHKNSVKIKLTS